MAVVRPFRGIRYDPQGIASLGDVVCPPFDTISPDLQETLYERSPFNIIRLEAGARLPGDTPDDNRYTRASAMLSQWMSQEVLGRDSVAALYLVEHTFTHEGREYARLELMSAVRLEEYERRVVLPHEFTRDADKEDRLALIRACSANLSPIMSLYSDPSHEVRSLLNRIMSSPPDVAFQDPGQQGYRMWRVEEGDVTAGISRLLASREIYIADGHHRYETALNYRALRREEAGGALPDDAACNYVMMGLVAFDDPGLKVLPYHRVLKGLQASALAQVRYELWKYFNPVPEAQDACADLRAMLAMVEELGGGGPVMGMMDPGGRGSQILKLRPGVDLEDGGVMADSEPWILEEQILRPILAEESRSCIDYVHDAEEASAGLDSRELQMAFLLKPFPLDLFKEIIDAGQKLPPKSTFFYPKLPTGLVMNPLDGSI